MFLQFIGPFAEARVTFLKRFMFLDPKIYNKLKSKKREFI